MGFFSKKPKEKQYTLEGEGKECIKLVFKDGVETIKKVEKEDMQKINEVVINEGAKVIGRMAFYGCGELTVVSVPSTVVEIGIGAFSG